MLSLTESSITDDYRVNGVIKPNRFDFQSRGAVSYGVTLNASQYEALKDIVDFYLINIPPLADCIYTTLLSVQPEAAKNFSLAVLEPHCSVLRLQRFFAEHTLEDCFGCPHPTSALKRFWFLFRLDWSDSQVIKLNDRDSDAAEEVVGFFQNTFKPIVCLFYQMHQTTYTDNVDYVLRLLYRPLAAATLLGTDFLEHRSR